LPDDFDLLTEHVRFVDAVQRGGRMFNRGVCCRMKIRIKSYEALLNRNRQTRSANYSGLYCRRQSDGGQTVGRALKRNSLFTDRIEVALFAHLHGAANRVDDVIVAL
jgi:hypothetical protein